MPLAATKSENTYALLRIDATVKTTVPMMLVSVERTSYAQNGRKYEVCNMYKLNILKHDHY